jgi:hypothetical protein
VSKRRKLCVNPKTNGADATKEESPQYFRAWALSWGGWIWRNEEPRHVFRGAGLSILRLMPSYAKLIYEALPRYVREFDVKVRPD